MFIIAPITSGSLPKTGLSPTVRIRNVDTNSLIVTDDSMEEVGDGWYKYNFSDYSGSLNYAIRVDGTNSVPNSERYLYSGNESFVEDVWSHPLSFSTGTVVPSGSNEEHTTVAGALDFIHNIQGGRWIVDETVNQMIFYKADGITEVARFNLFDINGSPDSQRVFERVRTGSI